MTQAGRIAGNVEFRAGDGPKMPIRKGPVEIELSQAEATLSWREGETRTAATMPLAEFKRYLSAGSIKLQD